LPRRFPRQSAASRPKQLLRRPRGCEGFGLISEPLAVHDLAIRKPPHLSEGEGRGDTALALLPAERRARHDAIACVDQGVDLGVRVAELVV
jgi:hypothetical protein